MTYNGIAVPTTKEINDREQLATVLEAVIKTGENLVAHERDQEIGHNLDEEADLSPLVELMNDESQTSANLSNMLSSLSVESGSQRSDWEPGEPCPECGTNRISVVEPREFIYTYDGNGDVVGSAPGEVNGSELDHYCKECDILLSEHPATTIFGLH